MLEDYCIKAKLLDGMDILDMGCGWGSLSLFLAKVSLTYYYYLPLLIVNPTLNETTTQTTPEISKFKYIFSIQLSYSKDLYRQHRHSTRFN